MESLEIEDPNDIVDREYGIVTRKKISTSAHSNTKLPLNENQKRYQILLILVATVVVTIFSSYSTFHKMEKRLMNQSYVSNFHSGSYGNGILTEEPITNKFYGFEPNATEVLLRDTNDFEISFKPSYSSKNPQNIKNLQAHYLHDEYSSPFSNKLYEEYLLGSAEKEQEAFIEKMESVREKYGAWNFHDYFEEERATVDTYHDYPNRDVPVLTFPRTAWQSDANYVSSFIDESLKLVRRVRKGIYEEYGYGSKPYNDDELKELLGVHLFEHPHYPLKEGRKGHFKVDGKSYDDGIAWMTKPGYNALVRKLLHAMMTNDDFFVVLAGHSAAAGHGNQFSQTKSMRFHNLMEPVFDKLGMNLITRNMAMGGLGTLQSSLAGDSIYGERDFLIWDSAMTEGNNDALDVFNRHALMSGERIPIIMIGGQSEDSHKNLRQTLAEGVGGFWHGDFHEPEEFIHYSDEYEDLNDVPYASQGLKCVINWDRCNENKFNSKCWLDRKDVIPKTTQSSKVPSQVKWHPGWRSHQWEARKWSLLMLHALETALTEWGEKGDIRGHPLPDEYWHIGDRYEKIREAVKSSHVHDAEEATCESEVFSFMPRICRTPLTAATEFTPRVDPEKSSIRNFLVPAPNDYIPHLPSGDFNLYDGPNLLLPETKIPDDEVDVHAIAIAASITNNSKGKRRILGNGKKLKLNNEIVKSQITGKRTQHRELDEIIPGRGWSLVDHPAGFCDGTAQSECNRGPNNNCILYEHNDAHGGLFGDGYSGWLVMELPGMKEGIVMIRMETWRGKEQNPMTKDWTEENNGLTYDENLYVFPQYGNSNEENINANNEGDRRLGGVPDPLPDDLVFEIAINGVIKTTWDKNQFEENRHSVAYNFDLFVLMDDPSMKEKFQDRDDDAGETIEIAIRVRGIKREATFSVSHVYWA